MESEQLRGCDLQAAITIGSATGRRLPYRLAAVAFLAVLVGSWSLSSAWVFSWDDRQPSEMAVVGMLEVELPEGTSRGTAVLVDDCGIVTNFHVAFGPWQVTALRAPSHAFVGTFSLTEVRLPDGSIPTARATPVVWGAYRGPDRQLRRAHEDWVYLVLGSCLGRQYGHFSLRPLDPAGVTLQGPHSPGGFASVGYSTGRQMIDPACSILAEGTRLHRNVWLHDCALQSGDSGGPIFERGTFNLVALGSGTLNDFGGPRCASRHPVRETALARWGRNCANIAVPLSWGIVERIRAAKVASGIQSALARLGYDSGPTGAINGPRARTAISQFQLDTGMSVTGAPSLLLLKLLRLKVAQSEA